MKVLFSVRPSYGHLYPLMPLTLAFRDAGHDVTVATGTKFVPKLQRLGFAARPAGRSILWAEEEAIRRNPALGDLAPQEKPKLGQEMFSRILPPRTVEDLVPLIAEIQPSMVIFDQADLGVPLAAALAGIPSAIHSYGMPWPPFMTIPMTANLQQLWRDHGVNDPAEDPIHGNIYIDISPPTIGDASVLGLPHRIPMRPVPFAEPAGGLPGWVTEPRNRPLVYVTLGTVVFERVNVIRAVIDGMADLEVDVLVSVGPEGNVEALGPLRPGVHAERFVPQDQLMPHLTAIAHHCGSGTMLGGLAHGIPQLALPQGADQFDNAARLAEVGAGVALMPDQITPDTVAKQMRKLLDVASYRQTAGSLRDEIAGMPSPRQVVEELVQLVG
ncbi:glycosyltransferase [soil metagenome]